MKNKMTTIEFELEYALRKFNKETLNDITYKETSSLMDMS